MNIETIISCVLIFCGAIIMFVSIVKVRSVLLITPFIAERHRYHIVLFLKLHRVLMVFFLVGYVVVILAFAFGFSLVSKTFVSAIFLFGAIFVLMGTGVQSWLLSEVQTTLRGLLPICLKCKKIRVQNAKANDKESWKAIETYISERADVGFSHGYCPDCFQQEMDNLKRRRIKRKT